MNKRRKGTINDAKIKRKILNAQTSSRGGPSNLVLRNEILENKTKEMRRLIGTY